MFKFSSLLLTLITVIAISPQSQSIAANVDTLSIQTSIGNLPTQKRGVNISETEQGKRLSQRRRILQEQSDDPGEPEDPTSDPTGDPTDDPRQQPPKQEGDETSPQRKKRCGCHRRHRRHHRHHDRDDGYRGHWERHDGRRY